MKFSKICNHCISLLKNCKTTKDCRYYMENGNMYIETDNVEVANIIEHIENAQLTTFTLYNILLEIDL